MRILIEKEQLADRVTQLATEITQVYGDNPVTVLGVMTGSLVLMADLIRQLQMPLRVGVMQARSYRGTNTTGGEMSLNVDMMPKVTGRDVLVVDDIFDTGHTMRHVLECLKELNPTSLRTLVLLNKSERREVAFGPDHTGFEIPNEFVVGYGLDYQDHYRNLPFIAVLEPHEIALYA